MRLRCLYDACRAAESGLRPQTLQLAEEEQDETYHECNNTIKNVIGVTPNIQSQVKNVTATSRGLRT